MPMATRAPPVILGGFARETKAGADRITRAGPAMGAARSAWPEKSFRGRPETREPVPNVRHHTRRAPALQRLAAYARLG